MTEFGAVHNRRRGQLVGTEATMTARMESVSVIVPVRDGGRYLGAALDSIVRQTLPAKEVLVIDDGSQDESQWIARGFGSSVRCVSTPPRGPAAARNRGVALASGELLAFLDADDLWIPTKLARQCELLSTEPELEAVFGGTEFFLSPDLAPDEARRLVCPREVQVGWLIGAMLIRRESFAQVGPLAETLRIGDFIDWADRAQAAGLRTRTTSDVVLRRRLHARNLSRLGRGDRQDFARVARAALQRRRAAAEAARRDDAPSR
jgi:glycosyltransferase involved in cell wall biosynthesis